MKLKYKWTAVYSDGTAIVCNEEDKSIQDPKRSAYYDVDHSKLIAFALDDGTNEYIVDLRDGHFEINQVPFKLDDYDIKEARRLIYFHRNFVNAECELDGSNPKVTEHTREFHLGWQATVNGLNVQRTIKFN